MRSRHVPPPATEQWWPVDAPERSDSRWTTDHVDAGWWDPGDLARTRLRLAAGLVDELLATLPAGAVGPDTVLLELGAGTGASAQELAIRTGVRPVLHESSELLRDAVVGIAREATVEPPGLPLSLADGSVDVVWAPTCFAHGGEDWAPLLAEAHRVLQPGGRLVAVHSGPGVWRWRRDDAWDEDTTGLLTLDLDRPATSGGPVTYVSRWWLTEHWGRGFDRVSHRAAGVLMPHPHQGHGVSSWVRAAGPALDADAFAAVDPDDSREGPAWRRQVALALAEQVAAQARRVAAIASARERAELLASDAAVEDLPTVRFARAERDRLRAEVTDLRESRWWQAAAPLRALHDRTTRGAVS